MQNCQARRCLGCKSKQAPSKHKYRTGVSNVSGKGPQMFLWVRSRATRVKITSDTQKLLNSYVTFVLCVCVYTHTHAYTVFTAELDLNLKKKLVMCYMWSILCMVLKLGHFGK
jgi:hypothetical protein